MHRSAVRIGSAPVVPVAAMRFVVAGAAFTGLPAARDSEVPLVSPYALWVDACFDDGQDLTGDAIKITSCARPHDNEAYAVIVDPAEPGAPFPGNKHVEAIANRGCLVAL